MVVVRRKRTTRSRVHRPSCRKPCLYDTAKAKCWGYGSDGRLGDGMSTQSTSPVAVLGLSTAERIALGGSHACAILTGGSVECWGSNSHGQLGDGTINSRMTPVPVLDIKMATSLALGEYNSCAALTGGTIQCWGANDRG